MARVPWLGYLGLGILVEISGIFLEFSSFVWKKKSQLSELPSRCVESPW